MPAFTRSCPSGDSAHLCAVLRVRRSLCGCFDKGRVTSLRMNDYVCGSTCVGMCEPDWPKGRVHASRISDLLQKPPVSWPLGTVFFCGGVRRETHTVPCLVRIYEQAPNLANQRKTESTVGSRYKMHASETQYDNVLAALRQCADS